MPDRSWLVGLLVLGACFKSGGGASSETPSNQAGKPRASDYTATLADPVGFLPIDSEVVLRLDAGQLRQSELWRMVEPRLAAVSELGRFKQACGIDPVTSIQAITVGLKKLGDATPEGVIVIKGIDRARLTECATRLAARDQSLVVDAGFVRIQATGTDPSIALTFIDARTLVAELGPSVTTDSLRGHLEAGSPLRGSPAFMQMLALVDLEAATWGVFNGSSKVFDQASAMGVRPKAVFGSVRLASGLDVKVRIRLDSAPQAQSLTSTVQGQLGMAQAFFDRLEVTAEDADMVVAAGMNDQQLANMVGMLGGMLGAP